MAGSWYPMRAGTTGRGHLRASDADREQAIDILKNAFVYGLLARDDLYVRAGQALTSRTYAELTALTADIPAGLIAAPPPSRSRAARRRKPVSKKAVVCAACLLILGPAVGAAFFTFYGGFVVLFVLAFIGVTVTGQPA